MTEDEKHVLLHCPRYESLRKELYKSINELCPNFKNYRMMINLITMYLLNSDGPIVKAVASSLFIHSILFTKST